MKSIRLLSVIWTGVAAFAQTAGQTATVDIPYEKFTLPNGLTVLVHEDHKAPIVAVNVWRAASA